MDIQEPQLSKLRQIGSVAYSLFETVCNSYELALRAIDEGIPGGFVECGVACGSQIGAMGYAAKVRGAHRTLWLYDSFVGIPMAGPEDDQQPGVGKIVHDVTLPPRDRLKPIGPKYATADGVASNLAKWGIPAADCVFVPGWFQDTVTVTKPERISILRLDGDLYESTKVCLDNLYELVSPGGFVIIDDYGLPGCKKAVDKFMGKGFKFNVVPKTQTVIWWKKK